jgi:hypothetical protein
MSIQTKPRPTAELVLTDHPTIKGKVGALNWYREVLGVEFKLNAIRAATASGDLPSFTISGATWYATRDLHSWVMSKRRSASDAQEVDA